MRYIFPKWTAEGAGNCGELSPHSILQRRAYVSCRGCVGIPPSAWGHTHEIRVVPRIKGQALFVPDRREFFCRGRFVLYSFGRRAGGVFVLGPPCFRHSGSCLRLRPRNPEQNKCTRLLRFCPQAGCILYFRKNYRSLRGEAAMAQKFSSCSEQAWKISRQRARRSSLRPSQTFSANAAQSRQAAS